MVYSSSTNFDWIIIKYGHDGTLLWTYTLNGTSNNYDAPAAIKTKNNFVYVTGEIQDSVTLLNFETIQLNRNTGGLNWKRQYNFHNLYDIAFAMDVSVGGSVTIAGASQDNLTKWDYCSIKYDSTGLAIDTTRIGGTTNSFDRPTAVKCDRFGNFYITGAASDSGASFNVRTAKVDSSGNLMWTVDFGTNGSDDEGNDLIVDDSGYVYVCGKSFVSSIRKMDYLLLKYNNNGTQQYYRLTDADSADDEARKMCFDNYGNIIMTGTAIRNGKKDILTLAFNQIGPLWKIYFNGEFDGDDEGTGITADANGNIFVSGESQITDSTYQQVTIKYKTDYFLVPQDTVPAPFNLLFYPNLGQIIDTDINLRDDIYYYTVNQYPKLYFHKDTVSFVSVKVDGDTATTDTIERIAMNFQSGVLQDPYTSDKDVHTDDQVLNYFLGQCPDGITGIQGSQRIMYSEVYSKTDVIFLNNSSGMKFQIVMYPGSEPQAVLHFTGQQSLQLISSSDLQVNGMSGSFKYERPLVYQLDDDGVRISLGWLASYYIDGDDVSFIMPGSYDHDKPLVIECAREEDQPMGIGYQPQWCSYFGGNSFDEGKAVGTDSDGNVYFTGFTQSSNFPTLTGFQILNPGNGTDAFISKFGKTGDPSSYPDATIDELLWSTYYGGSAHTVKGLSIAVSGDGSTGKVFVAGSANGEASFPVFAANSEYNQTFFPSNHTTGVIIGLDNASGGGGATPYRYASYFGGSGSSGVGAEQINAIKIDGSGNIYIAGTTNSAACSSAYYCSVPGDFGFPICNASGAGLVNQGNGDAFIAMFDNTVQLQWSTFYGGSETDVINAIAIDSDNNLYVAGETNSGSSAATPFPVTTSGNYDQSFGGGTSDAFVAKYSGTSRQWSTFFGGSGSDAALAITIDQENKVYFGGITSSFTPAPIYDNLCVVTSNDCNEPPAGNFPIADGNFTGSVGTPFYIQNVPFGGGPDPNCGYSCINALYGGGGTDGFIARFDKNANFDWSTYVGGSDNDKITSLTVANYEDYGHIPKHRICFSGQTFSTDFREYSQSNGLLTYLRSYDWPANHPTAFDHSGFLGLGEIPDRLCVPWTTYFIQQGANNPSSNPLQDDINAICAYDQHLYYTGSVIKDFVGNSPVPLQKMLNIPTAYGVFVHNGGGTDVLIGRHSFDRPIWDQIPENKKQESFSVYPNPSTGSYTLILENTQYKKINLQVFNMMGQILLSKDKEAGHNSDEIIIDLSGNPVGIYFLQLTLDDIKISKKIILQE